jgi:hypothetical protein
MRATMDKVDDGVPFVLAGTVTSWDPVVRVLDMGDQRFRVPASVPVPRIAPDVRVTIAGHKPAIESEPWTVTEIRLNEPGF